MKVACPVCEENDISVQKVKIRFTDSKPTEEDCFVCQACADEAPDNVMIVERIGFEENEVQKNEGTNCPFSGFVDDDDPPISECDTYDLQHDLALGLSWKETLDDPLNKAYYDELVRRGEKVPVNCKMVPNQYSYMNKKLVYDLADPEIPDKGVQP